MIKIFLNALLGTAALFCGTSCKQAPTSKDKPQVVTTTTMITSMVEEIGEDTILVQALMGPNVDPHLYRPSATDIQKLQNADAIFYNGLMLEGRMGELFKKLSKRNLYVYAVTQNIAQSNLFESEDTAGHPDPHVWFDPNLWIQTIPVVVEGLSEINPENAGLYKKNGQALQKKYMQTHQWAQERFSKLPISKRILITSHDAFNYFGHAYNFQVIGVQGISTTTEAGLADVTGTIDFIKRNNIQAIFVESSVSAAIIERISNDSGAVIGGELFSDAMGLPGEIEIGPDGEEYDVGTWCGMIKHNTNTIVEAL